jgi:hypothetical protein
MTTPEEATCLAVEELRERVEGKLSRIIRVWSNDLSTVLDALLAAEARIRVLEEALTNIEGKCADSIGGRTNYRAGDLQIIARRALAKGAPQ